MNRKEYENLERKIINGQIEESDLSIPEDVKALNSIFNILEPIKEEYTNMRSALLSIFGLCLEAGQIEKPDLIKAIGGWVQQGLKPAKVRKIVPAQDVMKPAIKCKKCNHPVAHEGDLCGECAAELED